MCKTITGWDRTKWTTYEVLLVDEINEWLNRFWKTLDIRRNIQTILDLSQNQTIQNTANYLKPYDTSGFKITYVEDELRKWKNIKNILNDLLMLSRSALGNAHQNNPIPTIRIEKEYLDEHWHRQIYTDNIPASNIIPII